MTRLFMVLLIVLFIVVSFLPMRFIIFWAVFYKFYKSRGFQKKRLVNNEEVAKVEFLNFLAENKLKIKDWDEPWETCLKKIGNSDFNKPHKMEKKLQLYF